MDSKKNVALFASGKGTNAINLIKQFKNNPEIEIKFVLCNNANAPVVKSVTKLGVKVYVVVIWLLIAGDHVPIIPFVDVVGKLNEPPAQIGATCVNVGTVGWFTVTVKFATEAHSPEFGINV